MTAIHYVFVYGAVFGHVRAMACVWRSENNSGESVFSPHNVNLGDQIQAIGLGSRLLDLLSHGSGP